MKKEIITSICFLLLLMSGTLQITAQQKLSFDLASVRNMRIELNGLNLSSFYHFNERITAGIEMNRFFPATHKKDGEEMRIAAWDFDLNAHYLLPFNKNWNLYPVAGISHTSEKEEILKLPGEALYERFWSYNTGAGLLWQKHNWGLHAEYLFTWGHINQQFLLAGFSYEIEWGGGRK